MKNFSKILLLVAVSSVALWGCKEKPPKPDASFEYCDSDDTTIVSPSVISTSQSINFKSTATREKVSGYTYSYVVYTSCGKNKYQPVFDMKIKDTVNPQSERGVAVNLTKNNGVYKYLKYTFTEVGTFKLYFVARVIKTDGGSYTEVIDSSKTITVNYPSFNKAQLTKINFMQGYKSENVVPRSGMTGWWVDSKDVIKEKIVGDSILCYVNMTDTAAWSFLNPASSKRRAFIFDFAATSPNVTINGVLLSSKSSIKVADGTKVVVVSRDGSDTKSYTIRLIKVYRTSSIIESAMISNVAGAFSFSAPAVINQSNLTITLPELPNQTTNIKVALTLSDAGTFIYPVDLTKVDVNVLTLKPIKVFAENGVLVGEYKVLPKVVTQTAAIRELKILKPELSLQTAVTGTNDIKVSIQKSSDIAKMTFGFTKDSYTKVFYNFDGVHEKYEEYKSQVVDCSKLGLIYFKSINGKDSTMFKVSIEALN